MYGDWIDNRTGLRHEPDPDGGVVYYCAEQPFYVDGICYDPNARLGVSAQRSMIDLFDDLSSNGQAELTCSAPLTDAELDLYVQNKLRIRGV